MTKPQSTIIGMECEGVPDNATNSDDAMEQFFDFVVRDYDDLLHRLADS